MFVVCFHGCFNVQRHIIVSGGSHTHDSYNRTRATCAGYALSKFHSSSALESVLHACVKSDVRTLLYSVEHLCATQPIASTVPLPRFPPLLELMKCEGDTFLDKNGL